MCATSLARPYALSLQRSRDGASSRYSEREEEEEDYVPYVPVRERRRAALENRLTQRQPASSSDARDNASAEGSRDGVSRRGTRWPSPLERES